MLYYGILNIFSCVLYNQDVFSCTAILIFKTKSKLLKKKTTLLGVSESPLSL